MGPCQINDVHFSDFQLGMPANALLQQEVAGEGMEMREAGGFLLALGVTSVCLTSLASSRVLMILLSCTKPSTSRITESWNPNFEF